MRFFANIPMERCNKMMVFGTYGLKINQNIKVIV